MPTAQNWKALDRVKRASAGQLLIKGARLLEERFLARVNRQGPKVTLRRAHTSLLPHIDQQGTRLTELARRLGITKQAAGQLVSDLESMELFERVEDPLDGRAKLVRFTHLGLESRKGKVGRIKCVLEPPTLGPDCWRSAAAMPDPPATSRSLE
jgi:DNA-binding MarR family transcriptional regulator